MDEYVVVKTFWKPTFAHRAATELEDAGIPAEVVDDEIVSADPLLANAVGGVKLRVHQSHGERAREILEGERDGSLDDGEFPESADFDSLSEEEQEEWEEMTEGLRCPKCGSQSIGFEPLSMLAWVVLTAGPFFLGGFVPGATPVGRLASTAGLLGGGIWLLILRKFPLACKDCQHWGARSRFDPRAELDAEAEDPRRMPEPPSDES